MTGVRSEEDQSSLRDNARRRLRRQLMVRLAIIAGGVPAGAVGGFLVGAADVAVLPVLLIGLGVALVLGGLAVIVWRLRARRMDPPLMLGADRNTQRAVRRAVRDGHAADPDIDLLAQDLVNRSSRSFLPSYLYVGFAAFFVVLAALADTDGWELVRSVTLAAMCLTAAAAFYLHQRRLRRYRGRAGQPAPGQGA